MSFHYEPIRSNLKEIRLVQISSADEFESEVVCDLKQAKIDDALPYEALSYAWGSPRLTETINLNGCSFKITPHLKTILCYLRRKDTVRTLWIDAICINQADVDERAEQVSIMRDIYRHCERDVLWLGDDPGKKGAMRRLRSDLPMHRWMLDFRELYYSEVWDRVWVSSFSASNADIPVIRSPLSVYVSSFFYHPTMKSSLIIFLAYVDNARANQRSKNPAAVWQPRDRMGNP